jgi:hypothetical protein
MLIALIFALAFFACKEPDSPQPHESTITAFGKTIAVKGDASISTADFNTAKGKLETAMGALYSAVSSVPGVLKKFTDMLDRSGFQIIIKTGNAEPDADANKSMTIGVDYLLNNDAEQTIPQAISDKVMADAFAD